MSINWSRQTASLVWKTNATTLVTLSPTTLTLSSALTGGMVLPAGFPFTATVNPDDASILFNLASIGGHDEALMSLNVEVLGGNSGFRQGALSVWVARDEGEEFVATWDGNPDNGVKIQVRNYGNNLISAVRSGAIEGFNVQARNRGDNLGWIRAIEANSCNDSGSSVTTMVGLHLRMENYGNVYTSVTGIDLEMSDENLTRSQTRTAMHIRNSDASVQSAVNNVFKISHSGTNGFTYLFHFNAATGDTVTVGDLVAAHAPDGSSIGADAYITVLVNATPYFISLYNSTV